MRNAAKIIGAHLDIPSIEEIYLSRLEAKSKKVMKDKFHPTDIDTLNNFHQTGKIFKGNKRFNNSFYTQAIKFFNGTRNL